MIDLSLLHKLRRRVSPRQYRGGLGFDQHGCHGGCLCAHHWLLESEAGGTIRGRIQRGDP